MVRFLRVIAIALLVLIVISASLTHPRPALSGVGLGVLLALVGIVVGVAGVQRARADATVIDVVFLAVLVGSAATLVAIQPNGPGYLGAFLAVAFAAWRLPAAAGLVVAVTTLVALVVASAVAGGSWLGSVATKAVGVIAFYLFALLARRLREEQEQARRLLLELEQSREALAQAAILGERQRLAREMHDVLAHSLSGLALQLEGARLLAVQNHADPKLTESVDSAHRLAKAGLEEARRAIGLLRDEALPGPERLQALAQSFSDDTGIPCSFEISGEEHELSSEARLTLYRVAQEALTNVRKHADANRVEVQLSYEPEATRLVVEDFGTDGNRAREATGAGYGLTGMRERAQLLGGELAATPTSSGFRVQLWIPN